MVVDLCEKHKLGKLGNGISGISCHVANITSFKCPRNINTAGSNTHNRCMLANVKKKIFLSLIREKYKKSRLTLYQLAKFYIVRVTTFRFIDLQPFLHFIPAMLKYAAYGAIYRQDGLSAATTWWKCVVQKNHTLLGFQTNVFFFVFSFSCAVHVHFIPVMLRYVAYSAIYRQGGLWFATAWWKRTSPALLFSSKR